MLFFYATFDTQRHPLLTPLINLYSKRVILGNLKSGLFLNFVVKFLDFNYLLQDILQAFFQQGMNQQKKIKGGISIEQVQVIPNFSGKTLQYALNERGSEILLDRDQVEDYEQIMIQQKNTNHLQQEKIPASLFKKAPQNITKQQTKIEQHIRNGNQKSSQITMPGSVINPSIIFQNQNCELCDSKENIIEDQNQQIHKLTTTNYHLTKELEHLTHKVTKYQDYVKLLEQQKIKMLQQNQQLKKCIQKQKSLILPGPTSTKPLILSKLRENCQQQSRQENKQLVEKSKLIKLNLAQNFISSIKSSVEAKKDLSIILVEVQTQKKCKARVSIQLAATVREEIKAELENKQDSQILVDTLEDVIDSINYSKIPYWLNMQEFQDLDLPEK